MNNCIMYRTSYMIHVYPCSSSTPMTVTESDTVEALVRDIFCGELGPGLARRQGALSRLGW